MPLHTTPPHDASTLRRSLVYCFLFLAQLFPVKASAENQRFAAGPNHTLAITPHGTIIAAGQNTTGSLGNPFVTTLSKIPVPVVDLPDPSTAYAKIIAVGAGTAHSLALDDAGRVWAWGSNAARQLGLPATVAKSGVPLRVAFATTYPIIEISTFGEHNLALDAEGQVWAWGDNTYGQCGQPVTSATIAAPKIVPLGTALISSISAGENHSMASGTANGVKKLWAWGYNFNGQLGNNTFGKTRTKNPNPTEVLFGTALASEEWIIQFSAGGNHSLAVTNLGRLFAWGLNSYGQLGNGTNTG